MRRGISAEIPRKVERIENLRHWNGKARASDGFAGFDCQRTGAAATNRDTINRDATNREAID
jgi:hypothetical protein